MTKFLLGIGLVIGVFCWFRFFVWLVTPYDVKYSFIPKGILRWRVTGLKFYRKGKQALPTQDYVTTDEFQNTIRLANQYELPCPVSWDQIIQNAHKLVVADGFCDCKECELERQQELQKKEFERLSIESDSHEIAYRDREAIRSKFGYSNTKCRFPRSCILHLW